MNGSFFSFVLRCALFFAVLLGLCFVCFRPLLGGRDVVVLEEEGVEPVSVRVLDGGGFERELRFVVKDFTRRMLPEGEVFMLPYQLGSVPGGAPDLPQVSMGFEGKVGRRAVVEVVAGEAVSLGVVALAPHPVRKARVSEAGKVVGFDEARVEDEGVYGVDGWYPSSLFEVEEAYAGRRRLTRVQYSPFQYNPVSGELRYFPDLTAHLAFVPEEDGGGDFDVQVSSTASGQGWSSEETGDCGCSERVERAEDYLPAMNGQAGDFMARRSGAEVNACVKVAVYETGLHRLSRAALVAAGVDGALLVGSDVRVYHGEEEVAVWPSTQGLFGGSDYVLFYGERFKGYYSTNNVYWVGFAPGARQMAVRSGAPLAGVPLVRSACFQQTFSDDVLYYPASNSSAPEYNGWYLGVGFKAGTFKTGPTVMLDHTQAAVAGSDVSLAIHAKSPTSIAHTFVVENTLGSVSGLATSFVWSGDAYGSFTQSFSVAQFDAGVDVQPFEFYPSLAGATDFVRLDEARFSFPRGLEAFDASLAFGGVSGAVNYRVSSLSGGGVPWVLDVTDPAGPVQVEGGLLSAGAGGTQTLDFGDDVGYDPCYLVVSDDRLVEVDAADVSVEVFRDLADVSRAVDYVMVVADPFKDVAMDLLAHRSAQGYRVLMVGLDEVMNEFGYGVFDVRSIKQFVGYAFHHWQDAPEFLTLVGDGTFDPLNHEISQMDFVPTPLGATTFVYTSLDAWYTTVNGGDSLPDLAVGRLTVNTAAELDRVIRKIESYEAAIVTSPAWASRAVYVADNEFVGNAFGSSAVPIVPSTFVTSVDFMATNICPFPPANVTRAFLNDGGQNLEGDVNAGAVRSSIVSQVNAGTYLLHFTGHGANTQWADERVFSSGDVAGSMNNGVWPLVGVFTCNNGVFHEPDGTDCMLEEMLLKDQKGSIAAVGPTGLAFTELSSIIAKEYYHALLNDLRVVSVVPGPPPELLPVFTRTSVVTPTLGEAFLNGLDALFLVNGNAPAELMFYMIFGDPALRVKP